MPRQNGTGPRGRGRMTGRGLGPCGSGEQVAYAGGNRMGNRCRQGFNGQMARRNRCLGNFGEGMGRGMWLNDDSQESQKRVLTIQKDYLQEKLNFINEQLEEL